ncbi:hypothetical protein [Halobaculum sp. MBLA0143]|uniref:DUF7346 family protein n=1 Tax=Halobaculum sp. MBLA0143 TaxID=3079933 RepID=UPI003526690B
MQTVTDEDGERLLVVKRAAEATLVRDPETGEESYREPETLTPTDDAPLSTAADAVDPAVRRAVLACPDDRALGLLVELVDRGPTAAETLTTAYDLCESDLLGLLGEFRAAGLVREATVAGRPGYEPTDDGEHAVSRLR